MNSARLDLRYGLILLALIGAFWMSGPGTRPSVPEVNLEEARALIEAGALVIDVRERAASTNLHLPGALLLPLEVLTAHMTSLEAHKAKSVVVYCGNGSSRGPEAVRMLGEAGFGNVVNLAPGFSGWRDAGFPVERG
jgi:rhodanese-related sulfurtransferase